MSRYIFKSARLGFRNWEQADLRPMAEINTDEEVMEFFPAKPSEKETLTFIARMQQQFAEKGFCYFAVDFLETGAFIGFIGLSVQTFIADFTPCTDIGWRLKRSEWGKGYAMEGALACLEYGFNHLELEHIYAMAPEANTRSEGVMKKTGMKKVRNFEHPKLLLHESLKDCVLYIKIKTDHNSAC
jgi:RimJ/RimL family protein N-acetyltransferase